MVSRDLGSPTRRVLGLPAEPLGAPPGVVARYAQQRLEPLLPVTRRTSTGQSEIAIRWAGRWRAEALMAAAKAAPRVGKDDRGVGDQQPISHGENSRRDRHEPLAMKAEETSEQRWV
jgi:hypothetical protein